MSEEADIATLKEAVATLTKTVDKQQSDIDNLKAFQRWVLGGVAVLAGICGMFASEIKNALANVLGRRG